MDKMDELRGKEKVSVYLEDVDITAIAMTSDMGACSGLNEPYILKSKDLELTENQISILKKIGEYDKLSKTKEKKEPIMSDDVTKELKKENEDLKKQLEDLSEIKKELKKTRIEKSLVDFPFDEELMGEVSKTMLDFDEKTTSVVVKAFTAMKDFVEKVEENELKKALESEAGASGDSEIVKKSLNEQIKESIANEYKGNK